MHSDTRYTLLLLFASLAKTGIYPRGPEYWLAKAVNPWGALMQGSNSWLFHWIYHALGATSRAGWPIVSAMMLLAAMIALLVSVMRIPEGHQRRSFAASIFASGVPAVLAFSYAFYDALFLVGLMMMVVGRDRVTLLVCGAFVMAGANPEQAVIAGIACTLVGVSLRDGAQITRAGIAATIVASLQLIVLILLRGGSLGDRAGVFFTNLPAAVTGHLAGNSIELFSWYGTAWIILISCTSGLASGFRRLFLWSGLLVLPALVTLTTLDGTRVFVLTSGLAFVYFAAYAAEHGALDIQIRRVQLATLLALLNPCLYYAGWTHSLWLPNQALLGVPAM